MGHAPKSITLGEEHRAGPEIRSLGSKASVVGVSGVALALSLIHILTLPTIAKV